MVKYTQTIGRQQLCKHNTLHTIILLGLENIDMSFWAEKGKPCQKIKLNLYELIFLDKVK